MRNEITDEYIRKVADRARRNGSDVVEALAAAQAFRTTAHDAVLKKVALRELRADLDRWSPAEFLRRVNKTAAPTARDMYNAILGYIDDYIEQEGK
jgi:hypothetical protein